MRYFPNILHNETLRSRIGEDITHDRFSHAYILEGPPGFGKHTLALQIAAALACRDRDTLPCGHCDSCEKILGGFSPDVLYFAKDEDKKEFTVDKIRQIRDGLYIAPNELQKRVYIIEDAECMNPAAQNAFLKILEEPPGYVVFLLLCANTANLLETVKSRAPILSLEPIPTDELSACVTNVSGAARLLAERSPAEFSQLMKNAGGSIGTAIRFCEESNRCAEVNAAVAAYLSALISPAGRDLDRLYDSLPLESAVFSDFLAELRMALRDVMLYKKDEGCALLHFADEDGVSEIAKYITEKRVLKLLAKIDDLADRLKFYLDPRLAAVTLCGDSKAILNESHL
ncbi:MAG: AAA family ATPase [Clostridia bacterium]|nr:AAA family ATPase [Clostridia bacterium]